MSSVYCNVGLLHILFLSLMLFMIGLIGLFINKKSLISILMSVEIMFLAININFVTFSTFLGNYIGQVMVLFIMGVSAAEIAIGLTIIIIIFQKTGNIWIESINNK